MDSAKQTWEKIQDRLRSSVHADVYSRWIAPLVPKSSEGGLMTLAVDNEWSKMFIENNYFDFIKFAAREVEPSLSFAIEVDPSLAPTPEPISAEISDMQPEARPVVRGVAAPRPGEEAGLPLTPGHTFDEFITGPSNSFAHAAALAVAENPGSVYNPLLIYGDTGLGKTHLMQAVGHAVAERNPRATIVYVTLEAMLNDYIESLRDKGSDGMNKMPEFRRRYRRVDVLLVDDIQFLSKSESLQEEFFNTFNALQNERKQIILTSDRPPSKIEGLSDRLVSRFQQGLVTSIECPSFETRLAILHHKQRNAAFPLPDSLLNFIAENVTSNVRQLEGAITKAVCYQNLIKKTLSIDILRDLLRELIDAERKQVPSCQDVQRVVAEEYDVRLADMTSSERPQNIALPRQIAMYLCRAFTGKSLPEIGKAFGKTHATVVHACKTIPGRMETDRDLKKRVELIVEKLGRDPSTL